MNHQEQTRELPHKGSGGTDPSLDTRFYANQAARAQRAERKAKEESLTEEQLKQNIAQKERERMMFHPHNNFETFNAIVQSWEEELKHTQDPATADALEAKINLAGHMTIADKFAMFKRLTQEIGELQALEENRKAEIEIAKNAEILTYREHILAEVRRHQAEQELQLLGLGKLNQYTDETYFAHLSATHNPKETEDVCRAILGSIQKRLQERNVGDHSANVLADQYIAFHKLLDLAVRAQRNPEIEKQLEHALTNIRIEKVSHFADYTDSGIKDMLREDRRNGPIVELGTPENNFRAQTHKQAIEALQDKEFARIQAEVLPSPLREQVLQIKRDKKMV